MAVTPGGVIGSAPVGFQPIGASTPTLAVATAVASSATAVVGASLFSAVAVASGVATSGVIGSSLYDTVGAVSSTSAAAATSTALKETNAASAGVTIVSGVAATLADAGAMSSASTNIAAAVGASLADATAVSQLPTDLAGGVGGPVANIPIATLPIGAQTQRGGLVIAISNAFKASVAAAEGSATVTPAVWGSVFRQFNVLGVTTTNIVGSRGFIWDFDSLDPETLYARPEPRNVFVSNEQRRMSVLGETRSLLTATPVKLRQNPRYRRVA